MPILMKGIRVQGIFVGSRVMFEAMNRAITVSQLHPVIDRVFEFQDASRRSNTSKAAAILARWSYGFDVVQLPQLDPLRSWPDHAVMTTSTPSQEDVGSGTAWPCRRIPSM